MATCSQYCEDKNELWGEHAQDYVSVLSSVLQVNCTVLLAYAPHVGKRNLYVRKFDDRAGPRVHILVYDGHAEVLCTEEPDAAVGLNFDVTFHGELQDW
jgi:hypothetical protein